MCSMRTIAGWGLLVVALVMRPLAAQSDADLAMRFFLEGGAYCFRVAPEGVALSDETEWTVMLLTGAPNPGNSFKIRTVDPGRSNRSGSSLKNAAAAVTGVWRMDSVRAEFFDRFATGIDAKSLKARVVKIAPPGLGAMKPGERAEVYLKFADRGTRVSFDKAADLTAQEFRQYADYFPD
jgi:hypothetical protein